MDGLQSSSRLESDGWSRLRYLTLTLPSNPMLISVDRVELPQTSCRSLTASQREGPPGYRGIRKVPQSSSRLAMGSSLLPLLTPAWSRPPATPITFRQLLRHPSRHCLSPLSTSAPKPTRSPKPSTAASPSKKKPTPVSDLPRRPSNLDAQLAERRRLFAGWPYPRPSEDHVCLKEYRERYEVLENREERTGEIVRVKGEPLDYEGGSCPRILGKDRFGG